MKGVAALTAVAVALLWATSAGVASSVYVTNFGGDSVSQYQASPSGLLAPLTPPMVTGILGPNQVAVSPDGRSVYVTSSFSNSVGQFGNAVAQYDIRSGGVLTPKSPASVAAGVFPRGVAVSPDGSSVYVTNIGSDTVSQYDVDAGGRLTPKAPATVPAGDNPGTVAVSADGANVYAANTASDDVSQFDVGAGGRLTPKAPATVPAGECPAAVVANSFRPAVYVTDQCAGAVFQYTVGARGALVPMSPPSVGTGGGAFGVAVSPDGGDVYVTNIVGPPAQGSISQYDVRADGSLVAKSPPFVVNTGSFPGGVAVSGDGGSLYAVNGGSDDLSQYSVDVGGGLVPKSPPTVVTGLDPIGVTATPLPRLPTSKDQCKNGGWRNFETVFKNQGDCVSLVATKGRNLPAP